MDEGKGGGRQSQWRLLSLTISLLVQQCLKIGIYWRMAIEASSSVPFRASRCSCNGIVWKEEVWRWVFGSRVLEVGTQPPNLQCTYPCAVRLTIFTSGTYFFECAHVGLLVCFFVQQFSKSNRPGLLTGSNREALLIGSFLIYCGSSKLLRVWRLFWEITTLAG